ncbi:MAG TPA: serine/threonine-protein kinase, partial [Kofleriaceae bacterium]|nr:serine/threonine-protein kinase [Kofleriaceae bacterium]
MADDRAADSSGELTFAVERLIGHDLDGRYRIEALLGKGGMGAVLRARHTFMDQPVAVKVLRPTLARDPAAARRFAREARGTFQVDSEHAVKVSDFGCSPDGLLYMVLELLEGHTVGDEVAREGRLTPRRAVHIARQVALALGASHRVGLIHRDLKPDNIMLVRRGVDPDFVKVLDFGLVKVIEGAGQRALSMAALTQGDLVFGTPDYMAPEQALGRPLDQRADLYALGATLFEMVAGRPPFEAGNAMEILVAHVRQAPPRLATLVAGLEPALDELVARLLAKDPAARPASADEVARELAALEARLAAVGGPARANAQTVDLPSLAGAVLPVPEAAAPRAAAEA